MQQQSKSKQHNVKYKFIYSLLNIIYTNISVELVPSHLKIQLLSADIYCDKQQDTHVSLRFWYENYVF